MKQTNENANLDIVLFAETNSYTDNFYNNTNKTSKLVYKLLILINPQRFRYFIYPDEN